MNISKKHARILFAALVLLLLSNAVLLFMLFNRQGADGDQKESAMRNFLKTEVGFSAAQLSSFDSLRETNRAEMRRHMDELRGSRAEKMRTLITSGFSAEMIDSVAASSARQYLPTERQMLGYFARVRNLCTAAQLAAFDKGLPEVLTRKRK